MKKLLFAILSIGLLIAFNALAKKEVIHMVTFDAPPFMNPNLPEKGALIFALKKEFAKAGYELKVSFAPFQRAKVIAFENPDILGYVPVSPYELDPKFLGSKVILDRPWVIAERKDSPIKWKKPEDLAKYVGGSNHQYTHPHEIAKLMKEKKITVEMAPNDTLNLLKLGKKHVDYVFVEETMFYFITQNDPQVKAYADQLQINPVPVEILGFNAAFKRSAKGQKVLEDFNRVVSKEDIKASIDEYFKKYKDVK